MSKTRSTTKLSSIDRLQIVASRLQSVAALAHGGKVRSGSIAALAQSAAAQVAAVNVGKQRGNRR